MSFQMTMRDVFGTPIMCTSQNGHDVTHGNPVSNQNEDTLFISSILMGKVKLCHEEINLTGEWLANHHI
jgi:hypothetical protein